MQYFKLPKIKGACPPEEQPFATALETLSKCYDDLFPKLQTLVEQAITNREIRHTRYWRKEIRTIVYEYDVATDTLSKLSGPPSLSHVEMQCRELSKKIFDWSSKLKRIIKDSFDIRLKDHACGSNFTIQIFLKELEKAIEEVEKAHS